VVFLVVVNLKTQTSIEIEHQVVSLKRVKATGRLKRISKLVSERSSYSLRNRRSKRTMRCRYVEIRTLSPVAVAVVLTQPASLGLKSPTLTLKLFRGSFDSLQD